MDESREIRPAWLRGLLFGAPWALNLEQKKVELVFPGDGSDCETSITKWNHDEESTWTPSTHLDKYLAYAGQSGSLRSVRIEYISLFPEQLARFHHIIATNPVRLLKWWHVTVRDPHTWKQAGTAHELLKMLASGKHLRQLRLYLADEDADTETSIIDIIAKSSLPDVHIECLGSQTSAIIALIEQNRTIRRLSVDAESTFSELTKPRWIDRLSKAVINNWVLLSICYEYSDGVFACQEGFKHLEVGGWNRESAQERSVRSIHARTRDYALALSPLRLPVYEMLALIDWLPPMSIRYVWQGDPAFDPHRLRKVRLIEALTAAYRDAMGRVQ